MSIKILDLFSGIGGFSLAGRWANFETIQFVEINNFCQKVLRKHWPNVPMHDDIKTFNFTEKVNLITGGFPCQPFSNAGKKRGRQDVRYLWNEFYRIIVQSKPNWVIAENVCGIIPMELDNIIADMEKAHYETSQFVLPACAANAPHRRDRIWIIANYLGKRCCNGSYHREEGQIQKNILGNMETVYKEWEKLKPINWKIMQARDILSANAEYGRNDDGLPYRLDRIKSLGNSIVPQVIFPIMKFIYDAESIL